MDLQVLYVFCCSITQFQFVWNAQDLRFNKESVSDSVSKTEHFVTEDTFCTLASWFKGCSITSSGALPSWNTFFSDFKFCLELGCVCGVLVELPCKSSDSYLIHLCEVLVLKLGELPLPVAGEQKYLLPYLFAVLLRSELNRIKYYWSSRFE